MSVRNIPPDIAGKQGSSTSKKLKIATSSTKTARTKYCLKCKDHYLDTTSPKCENCIRVFSRELPLKRLPRIIDILCFTICCKEKDCNKFASLVTTKVMQHWVALNVYPKARSTVKKMVENLWKDYIYLKDYPQEKKNKTYWWKYTNFFKERKQLFDIIGSESCIKTQEKAHNLKMTDKDWQFYHNMKKVPQVGFAEGVDKNWRALFLRNKERNEKKQIQQEKAAEYKKKQDNINNDSFYPEHEAGPSLANNDTANFCVEEGDFSSFQDFCEHKHDDLPQHYRHVRSGQRLVKKEYYQTMLELKSKLHMSENQAQNAICIVANTLFGRSLYGMWRPYSTDHVIGPNTLPAPANTRSNESACEAAILRKIVIEIMSSDSNTAVIYSNDGSAKRGVGKFIVQSFLIGNKRRVLPTLGIASENKENLAELQVHTYKMLSAASNNEYSYSDILRKVDFYLSDSAKHNLGVMNKVCEKLAVNNVPDSLLCHVHPMMMFQRKVKELWMEIHNGFGTDTIKQCFVSEVSFERESFISKALTCLSSFINSDFSEKPWNRQADFDTFIAPKKNESLSLKDHRFNRIFDCCIHILYHMDDIRSFLESNKNILNGLAILDRTFVNMDLLTPIFCATALIGIHFANPFFCLMLNKSTSYETLLERFPMLYNDFKANITDAILHTEEKVASFVDNQTFQTSLPKPVLRQNVQQLSLMHKDNVLMILQTILPRLAEGFSVQRGALFGFGPNANDTNVRSLKIVSLPEGDKRTKMLSAPVHNLHEERSVGSISYELNIRGRQHLESVSKKHLLNKSIDIVNNLDLKDLRTMKKAQDEIKKIKLEWKQRQDLQQKTKYSEREKASLQIEASKYRLLHELKSQQTPGPFTSEDDVEAYMQSNVENSSKNSRLYKEVRYAKMSSVSLHPSAPVFKLKRNGKNLTTAEYANNLKEFFNTVKCCKEISNLQLNTVVSEIFKGISSTKIDSLLCEHIIAVWKEGPNIDWYVGVVEEARGEELLVKYMERVEKAGKIWMFPETASVWETTPQQIIQRQVKVHYFREINVKCSIDNEMILEMNKKAKKFR